jgi:hypothetical protein
MSAIEKALYNIQKFQILSLFTSDSATKNVSQAYAFAWEKDLFPIGHHGCDWHLPHEESFKISRAEVDELGDFLDGIEREGKTITFYQLEDHYGVRNGSSWERMDLVFACRYFRLNGWFTEEFWKGMVGHSDCPSESHSILRDYEPRDVYFE